MAIHTPRPLQLANSATTPTPTNDAFSLPSPPSSFRQPKRLSDTTPTRNPLQSPTTIAETKAARRQSSIGYFPPDSAKSQIRGSLIRRNSLGALHEGLVSSGSREESWRRTKDRTSTVSLHAATASTPSLPSTPGRERPPLTLTEKHADLLRFIAQKESKCLELRSQLALHEAELAQLKRKWEQIVNKGLEHDLPSAPANGSDPSSAVLEGIKEGMSRLLAAGFSASASASTPNSTLTTTRQARSRPQSLIYKSHFTEESNSSISTFWTTYSNTRSSQSSMSSCDEMVKGGVEEGSERENEGNFAGDDSKNQILMVRDTGATPTMSPNPQFHHQQNRLSQSKRVSLHSVPLQQNENVLSGGGKWSSDVEPTTSKVHRRKSHEAARTLDFKQLDFSSLSPSVMLSATSESRKNPSPGGSPALGGSSSPSFVGNTMNGVGGASSRPSSGVGLAPMSSIPGLGMTTGAMTPPVSSWMDTVGKQLGKLQKSSTFTKNQKRASVLLADMSTSIVNVLTPPTANGTGHESADNNTSTRMSSTLKLPPTASPNPSSSGSLLDDDDDETARLGAAVLQPITSHSPTIPRTNKQPLAEAKGDFDDEEWGW